MTDKKQKGRVPAPAARKPIRFSAYPGFVEETQRAIVRITAGPLDIAVDTQYARAIAELLQNTAMMSEIEAGLKLEEVALTAAMTPEEIAELEGVGASDMIQRIRAGLQRYHDLHNPPPNPSTPSA